MNIKQLFEKTSNGFKEFVAKIEMTNVVGLVEELSKHIKKGTTDKTFILDNGERQSAIVDVDDEVEYSKDNAYITLISSDGDNKGINLFSATNNQAGLMSVTDKKKIDAVIHNDGYVYISNDNFHTTIGNNAMFIYDETKGLSATEINNGFIVLRNKKENGVSLVCDEDNNLYIDKPIKFNKDVDKELIFGNDSHYMRFNDISFDFSDKINANEGIVVADNKEASFGSKGILLKNGGIDFQFGNHIAHLVNARALGLDYDGVACKESFYVNGDLVINGEIEFDTDLNITNSDLNINNGFLFISDDSTISFKKGIIEYVSDNDGIGILSDDKIKGIIFDTNNTKLMFKNKSNNDDNITFDYDTSALDFNVNAYFYGSVITNGSEIEIRNTNGNTLMYTDGNSEITFNTNVTINNAQLNVNDDAIITGSLDVKQVNADKVLLSSTTDKVTDSTSISNTDIVVSQSGNNNDFSSTLNKNSLTIQSEDSFNGTSKAIYGAGTLSVSKKEEGATYTQSTNLDENSISFVKTNDSGSKSTKALWIDSNGEFNFTGANVNINKELNTKSDVNFYSENIYYLGKSRNGNYNGCHLWFRDNTTQNDTAMFMLNDKITISHETSASQVYPFILDPVNSTITLKNASKNISDIDRDSSVYTPNSITINSKINTDDIKGTSKFEIQNLGCTLTVNPTGIEDITENITSFDVNGFGVYRSKDDNNYSVFSADTDMIHLRKVSNGNDECNLLFADDGVTIDYNNASTKILKADATLKHENYNITIENTNTSTNKEIDVKNYNVLINDNSKLGFKYNNEIYVFNTPKAIELGLLTKV